MVSGEKVINRRSAEESYDSETALCDSIIVDTCHYTFVQTHGFTTQRGNPNVRCGLQWLWFDGVGGSVLTVVPLWWGMSIIGEAVYVEAESRWKISASSSQFCTVPKTVLKYLHVYVYMCICILVGDNLFLQASAWINHKHNRSKKSYLRPTN